MYESKAQITSIKATSRASVKIKNDFYTLEYCEERIIPDIEGVDIEEERKILWDVCNGQVDAQVQDIVDALRKNG